MAYDPSGGGRGGDRFNGGDGRELDQFFATALLTMDDTRFTDYISDAFMSKERNIINTKKGDVAHSC